MVKVPSGDIYVLAKELVSSVMQAAKIDSWEVLGTLMGSDLELMRTKHPIMDRESVVICGDHVTLDAGTGCVHTAPGFGADDFIVCQKYDIPIIVPVDGKGMTTEDAGKYANMYYEKTTPIILEDLKACNALLAIEEMCTAIRTAGAAKTRSSSVPLSSGSVRSMRSRMQRLRLVSRSSGFPPGARSA